MYEKEKEKKNPDPQDPARTKGGDAARLSTTVKFIVPL